MSKERKQSTEAAVRENRRGCGELTGLARQDAQIAIFRKSQKQKYRERVVGSGVQCDSSVTVGS